MIRLVVALPSEARPLVRRFGLRPVGDGRPRRWGAGSVRLAVSGIGREAAAAAVRCMASEGAGQPAAWLNVGIAGHRSLPLGEVVLGREVVDGRDGTLWRLRPLAAPPCGTATVTTVDRPELEYPGESVYEMEAAGFCATLRECSPGTRFQVLKVVSDNLESPPGRLTGGRVEELIAGSVETVARVVRELGLPPGAAPDRSS